MRTKILAMVICLGVLPAALAWGAEDAKPVAVCKDGKTYYNRTGKHQGACRGHGGVSSWSDGTPVRTRDHVTSYR